MNLSSNPYYEYLLFAKKVASLAGSVMKKYFKEDNGSSYKFDNTIVTKADTEINDMLIKMVKEEYPYHSVDGEEDKFGNSNYVWVCDPVDGTAMYARGIPVAVFSLALVIDGEPIVGVVYDPFCDELYYAIKKSGAFKNDKKIEVHNYRLENIETIGHCDLYPRAEYDISKVLDYLRTKTYLVDIGSITRSGICVGTGNFTFAIFTGTKHKNCDIAAVKIIVEEAGGIVTDLFGNSQRYDTDINGAVISNGVVHDEVISLIKENIVNKRENK